jgi:isoleucyl-tRNA synthetase
MSTPIMAGGDIAWSDELLNDQIKDVLIPIWNTYRYLSLYANIHSWSPESTEFTSEDNLDKWIESYMKSVSIEYSKALESYNIPASVKLIQPCIDNISQWWIRRSRNRFADGDTDALQTLYATMVLFAKTFAPQMPFIAEEIYQNLVVKVGIKNSKESVHLEEYPEFSRKDIDNELLEKMSLAREICSNGLQAREISKISLRQPLAKAYIGIDDEFVKQIVMEELNLKEIVYSEKPVEQEGVVTVGENELAVSLDTNMTDELRNEGVINVFLRKYRDLRKKKGLKMDDKVIVTFSFQGGEVQDVLKEYVLSNKEALQAKDVKVSDNIELFNDEFVIASTKILVLFG